MLIALVALLICTDCQWFALICRDCSLVFIICYDLCDVLWFVFILLVVPMNVVDLKWCVCVFMLSYCRLLSWYCMISRLLPVVLCFVFCVYCVGCSNDLCWCSMVCVDFSWLLLIFQNVLWLFLICADVSRYIMICVDCVGCSNELCWLSVMFVDVKWLYYFPMCANVDVLYEWCWLCWFFQWCLLMCSAFCWCLVIVIYVNDFLNLCGVLWFVLIVLIVPGIVVDFQWGALTCRDWSLCC